jgi:hypothetical protein
MKKILVLLALFVALPALAETINWTNPTTYTDSTPIPANKAAVLQAEIQYRTTGAFTPFGTTTGGATTFTAPYVTAPGATSYWRIRAISPLDNNATSAWSPDYPFVKPFQTPGAGAIMSVQ